MIESETDGFRTRAARIFGTYDGGVAWPYGLAAPPARHSGLSPERLEKAIAHAHAAQRTIVEWAERHGLRYSKTGCCQLWLLRSTSRQCRPGTCRNNGGLDYAWLDHANGWLKDSRPAVVTSAPYSAGYDADNYEIKQCLASDGRLRVTFGSGWYGYGSRQIVLWRTDCLDEVEAAQLSA